MNKLCTISLSGHEQATTGIIPGAHRQERVRIHFAVIRVGEIRAMRPVLALLSHVTEFFSVSINILFGATQPVATQWRMDKRFKMSWVEVRTAS